MTVDVEKSSSPGADEVGRLRPVNQARVDEPAPQLLPRRKMEPRIVGACG